MALAGNTLIWGATFVLVKKALDDVTPFLFLALRFTLASAVLLALFRGRARFSMGGVWAGVFLFAGYVFQTVGLRFTSAPKSAFITGMSIALVPLIASAVYRNRPSVAEAGGVALASAGMALLTLEGGWRHVNRGDVLTFFCAVAFAIHIVAQGHFAKHTGFESLALGQVATAAALALCSFWWAETPRVRWSGVMIAAVVVTGLLATALALSVQAWAQRHTSATRTALIYALEPVFAWFTSFLLAAETLTGRAASGAILILSGIVLVEMKPADFGRHPSK